MQINKSILCKAISSKGMVFHQIKSVVDCKIVVVEGLEHNPMAVDQGSRLKQH